MNIGNPLTRSAYELILGDAKRSDVEAYLVRSHGCTPEQASDAVTAAQNTFIKGIEVANPEAWAELMTGLDSLKR